jgi:hypothetical protein
MMPSLKANSFKESFAKFAFLLPGDQVCCTIWPNGLMDAHYLVTVPFINFGDGEYFLLVIDSSAVHVEPFIADY